MFFKQSNGLCQIVIVLAVFSGISVVEGQIIYVDTDATGANDGSSWADAFNYLQEALGATTPASSEIRVAQGTYKPHEGIAYDPAVEREQTFQLVNGIVIKGGYAGYGTPDPNNRDISPYETILSGDLDGNDAGDLEDPSRGDNSYHIITGSGTDATAILDGFTVTGGNANGSYPDYYGGGMYNDDGDPVINDCRFSRNSAERNGGAMYNTSYSDPAVSGCVFNMNFAGDYGGAIYSHGGDPEVSNCKFSGNSAGIGGGGISLSNNTATITYCSFIDNAALNGGGIYNNENDPILANCTFIGNSAGNAGGGIYNDDYGGALVDNCTFIGNSGGDAGGGIYNRNDSVLKSCILWGNTAPIGDQIANHSGSSASVSYSDIQGFFPGTGNIDTDPLFIDLDGPDNTLGTEDDNLRLKGYSPCINAGNPSGDYTGQVDLDNQPRVTYGRVDMGVDEVFPISGDFEPDEDVDITDFAIFAHNWWVGVQ